MQPGAADDRGGGPIMVTIRSGGWTSWAREWGLAHQKRQGLLQRTEAVTGARGGLLLRAGWGDEQYPGLTVTIRFPRAVDVQRLRDQLAQDVSLDALPGKASARNGTKVVAAVRGSS